MPRRKGSSPHPGNSVVSSQHLDRFKMEQNLQNISSNLNRMEAKCPLENVRKWSQQRKKSIASLQDTAKELDDIRSCSNVARFVGDGAAVIGTLAELFGHFMQDSDTSREVKNFGKNLSRIGSVASCGTSVIEESLFSKKVRNVKKILKEDEELLTQIMPWFQRTSNIDSALNELFGIGLQTNFEQQGKVIIFQVLEMFKKGTVVLSEVIDNLKGMGYDIANAEFKHFIKVTLPKFLDRLQDISNDERLFLIFEEILGMKNLSILLKIMQSCISISKLTCNLDLGSLMQNLSISTELVRFVPCSNNLEITVCQSVFVAGKLASLISTSDELVKDEPSEYTKALRDLREQMIEEYNQICEAFVQHFGRHRYLPLPQNSWIRE